MYMLLFIWIVLFVIYVVLLFIKKVIVVVIFLGLFKWLVGIFFEMVLC